MADGDTPDLYHEALKTPAPPPAIADDISASDLDPTRPRTSPVPSLTPVGEVERFEPVPLAVPTSSEPTSTDTFEPTPSLPDSQQVEPELVNLRDEDTNDDFNKTVEQDDPQKDDAVQEEVKQEDAVQEDALQEDAVHEDVQKDIQQNTASKPKPETFDSAETEPQATSEPSDQNRNEVEESRVTPTSPSPRSPTESPGAAVAPPPPDVTFDVPDEDRTWIRRNSALSVMSAWLDGDDDSERAGSVKSRSRSSPQPNKNMSAKEGDTGIIGGE